MSLHSPIDNYDYIAEYLIDIKGDKRHSKSLLAKMAYIWSELHSVRGLGLNQNIKAKTDSSLCRVQCNFGLDSHLSG